MNALTFAALFYGMEGVQPDCPMVNCNLHRRARWPSLYINIQNNKQAHSIFRCFYLYFDLNARYIQRGFSSPFFFLCCFERRCCCFAVSYFPYPNRVATNPITLKTGLYNQLRWSRWTQAHTHMYTTWHQMATSNANENTDEELKVKLNGRQWNAYLQQQAATSATMSAIDVLCNIYMTAMNDNSTKDARASSTMLRDECLLTKSVYKVR